MKDSKPEAVAAFLDWADKRVPGIKRRIIKRAKQQASNRNNLAALNQSEFDMPLVFPSGDFATETSSTFDESGGGGGDNGWLDNIIGAAEKIIPTVYQYKTQKEVWDLQMERARQGQEPLDVSQYSAPPVRVQVEPSPMAFEMDPETKQMLTTGGLIAGGLLLWVFLSR